MAGYPCCCTSAADPCSKCSTNTTPENMTVYISNVANGQCSAGASEINGTYTLPQDNSDACYYSYSKSLSGSFSGLDSGCSCGTSDTWTLLIEVTIVEGAGLGGWTVDVQYYPSGGTGAKGAHRANYTRTTPTSTYDCDSLAKATASFNSEIFGGLVPCSPGDSYDLQNATIEVEPS